MTPSAGVAAPSAWPKRRKYRPGPHVAGTIEAVSSIQRDRYLYFNDKPMHPAVMRNWSLVQISRACRFKMLRHALDNSKSDDVEAPAVTEFAEVE
jgi:hypothetical protein